ncbi:RAD protein (Pv-fam-e) [Plasmodium ovale wallikeri]|uniref:RAD protein (Pv-fam-e) n=1 Tax=Plasmodium ovale wallikeri TaxID=864142 RepID=A0A1A9AMB9_PLAOA|nr:RAD protein (Pv-fam-e) [Plasmodium ovale wallikeri]SBT58286.1 RAD protein (Pv-fam-e) [Plasmodium ovale wallikeri]
MLYQTNKHFRSRVTLLFPSSQLNICSPNVNTTLVEHPFSRCIRTLAEFSLCENWPPTKGTLYVDKKSNFHNPKKTKLPYGCTDYDLSKNLTLEDVYDYISQCSLLITAKDMYIAFYYHNKHLNTAYKGMTKRLMKTFEIFALENGMLEEELREYLMICKKNLNANLNRWNEISYKDLHTRIQKKIINTKRNFKLFLRKCEGLWKRGMINIESTWIEDFITEIEENQNFEQQIWS